MKKIFFLYLLLPFFSFSQSDLEKVIRGGEVIINGLGFLKNNNASSTKAKDSKIIESVCVKNKLSDKITFKIYGKDDDDNEIKKELVVQNDGKECFLELPKGIYTYEIILANKEIFKKGEYNFNEEIVITVKDD
ncbi:hypothetical protein [Flavobacterium sp.]|uniref:hypothetical protein n=1 Tax=Flavobacterium sp. TaxID=239 RepID=UPI0037502C7C